MKTCKSQLLNRLNRFAKDCRAVFLRASITGPNECDVLIYDESGAHEIKGLFAGKVNVLHTRREKIYIAAAVWALIKRISPGESDPLQVIYAEKCTRISKAKIIATYIDNDFRFYRVAARLKDGVQSISIQNGMRVKSELRKSYEALGREKRDLHCTQMLTYNDWYKRLYSSMISVEECLAYGSHRSNQVPISKNRERKDVIFISQFRNRLKDSAMYEPDKQLLRLARLWCERSDHRLWILGCTRHSTHSSSEEKDFYDQILGEESYGYISKKDDIKEHYRQLDCGAIILFIDSAMGYESVGRGNRFAAFPTRHGDSSYRKLGFEDTVPKNYANWSSTISQATVFRSLDYVSRVGTSDWRRLVHPDFSYLMEYGPTEIMKSRILHANARRY